MSKIMKENHLQTPQREQAPSNRRSKLISDQSKKLHKVSRKSLNAEFIAFSGDVLAVESPNDSNELSSISEILDDTFIAGSAESFIDPSNQVDISAITPNSDLTPSSSLTISKNLEEGIANTPSGTDESKFLKFTSIEKEMMVKQLRNSMVQVWNSGDVDSPSKKILDALVNVVIENWYGIPDDKDGLNKLISSKALLVLLSFLLWVLAVSAVVFYYSHGQRPLLRPTPS